MTLSLFVQGDQARQVLTAWQEAALEAAYLTAQYMHRALAHCSRRLLQRCFYWWAVRLPALARQRLQLRLAAQGFAEQRMLRRTLQIWQGIPLSAGSSAGAAGAGLPPVAWQSPYLEGPAGGSMDALSAACSSEAELAAALQSPALLSRAAAGVPARPGGTHLPAAATDCRGVHQLQRLETLEQPASPAEPCWTPLEHTSLPANPRQEVQQAFSACTAESMAVHGTCWQQRVADSTVAVPDMVAGVQQLGAQCLQRRCLLRWAAAARAAVSGVMRQHVLKRQVHRQILQVRSLPLLCETAQGPHSCCLPFVKHRCAVSTAHHAEEKSSSVGQAIFATCCEQAKLVLLTAGAALQVADAGRLGASARLTRAFGLWATNAFTLADQQLTLQRWACMRGPFEAWRAVAQRSGPVR